VNPRERLIARGILSVFVLAGAAFLFHSLVLAPMQETDNEIAQLKKENDDKATRIDEILADQPKLERWRQLSLPGDADLARHEYEKYLQALFRQNGAAHGLIVAARPADSRSGPTLPSKGTIYTKLSFTVTTHATLSSFVKVLEKFYRTSLLQQIKTLSIQKPADAQATPGELDITLTIEALCLSGAEKRLTLLPVVDRWLLADLLSGLSGGPLRLAGLAFFVGPSGPGGPGKLAELPRKYAAIAGKNVFLGNAAGTSELDVAQLVSLTDITTNGEGGREANLHNGLGKTRVVLSAKNASFRIMSGGEVRVEGKMVGIGDRVVYFRSGEQYYAIHLGQNLAAAMKKPLTPEEARAIETPKSLDKPGL
jgi:hypothetical protein